MGSPTPLLGRDAPIMKSSSLAGQASGPARTSHEAGEPAACRWAAGTRDQSGGCARRSPTESSEDAGSTPATSKSAQPLRVSIVGGEHRTPDRGITDGQLYEKRC